jgi:hypothetical protein
MVTLSHISLPVASLLHNALAQATRPSPFHCPWELGVECWIFDILRPVVAVIFLDAASPKKEDVSRKPVRGAHSWAVGRSTMLRIGEF